MRAGNEMRMTRIPTLAEEAGVIRRETPGRPEMLQGGRVDTAAR